jgi:trans-aconitate methyltransferase
LTGDAVPAHLLTREAFQVHLHCLRPGGVIAVNISNNYLDPEPVIRGVAGSLNLVIALLNARAILSATRCDRSGCS